MLKQINRNEKRKKRHMRARQKLTGTPERPRLNVYRSLDHIYAQIIDDTVGNTIVSASTLDKELKDKLDKTSNKEAAKLVGELVAKRAQEKGIKEVVFDRGGYIYHGRVKELADAAREAGLKF
ncbi:50S ribosomal protein L18 [Anaerosalibacter bizertensis]|uniref:Large ribosomal subunit protein uL18 n=1 Tax=Anaerosalibacter bizertensis TaxID=932217 RepID=A0A9Q4FKD1_9FIRM|nr:50S ribosomal protein L18 [Anaerosalibacter bizertensis]MBV1816811.1 50S ribosomal protein L18 [Bacteroidales bacterium MSK.15.36]MCB5559664.1 50S ribosomal protein L18 [Anaerosalibacter bizertensis]MCG4564441.1 50S ribosomal protein L18 [Anaerosalibacter bizertensis]MCG4582474.1 50S ribosomal protein L18 [Anaerosalibacter bizertensis]